MNAHPSHAVAARLRLGAIGATAAAALVVSVIAGAQSVEPPNHPRENEPRWHALVGATLIPAPGEQVENATVVIRDGVIVSVASGGQAPRGARVWDYSGYTLYAGFIDAHVGVDAPAAALGSPGSHWSPRVQTQRTALDAGALPDRERDALRAMGFTAAAIAPKGGVFRGQGALVSLRSVNPRAPQQTGGRGGGASRAESAWEGSVLLAPVYHSVAFESGGFGGGSYPTSQMGAIAMVRQTLIDADWHAQAAAMFKNNPSMEPPQRNDALAALGPNNSEQPPLLIDLGDELDAQRAAKIGAEFGRRAMMLGSGTEFRRLQSVAEAKLPIILPLDFPEAPAVATLADAESVDLRTMMTWEQAPTNPRRLDAAGVTVALTTDKIRRRADFLPNLRKAVEHGLEKDRALAMLTTNPASLLGAGDRIGQAKQGYLANLVAVEGDIFDKDAKVRDVWVEGERFEITRKDDLDVKGTWALALPDGGEATLTIREGNKIAVMMGEQKADATRVRLRENRLSFLLEGKAFDAPGQWMITAVIEGDEMLGTSVAPDGATSAWTGARTSKEVEEAPARARPARAQGGDAPDKDAEAEHGEAKDEEKKDEEPKKPEVPEELPVPFGAYGLLSYPAQEDVAVVGATIWTAGPDGIIQDGALVVVDGKISYVGPKDGMPRLNRRVRFIDGAGLHVSPGMIDAHSHTGIGSGLGGVNEVGQPVTSEVRVADMINPDAIGWYQQLAGGLTAANQLHGSANAIGGQNNIVKLRWGVTHADDMRFEGAPEGIKFALGENPKRDSWRYRGEPRYPQSRMGVETLIRERFVAAQDYRAKLERYEKLPARERDRTPPPARDLELEAIAEILDGTRLVHAHSYRQDEILMLCRVAQDFGFTIGTFQHVLEGYKVAEAIKETAIGASSFSDWWGYKFEVYDAIPDNGAIMHEVGVNVTFNSDSNELARRMNGEAAKAVRHGKVDPHEALKFVTYNAAVQLGVQDRVGSLEKGKDADFVLWSGDPLSNMSRTLATWIDGREMFSVERDRELREVAMQERQRIIQKLLADTSAGRSRPGMRAGADAPADEHESRRVGLLERYMLEMHRMGQDANTGGPGQCGMIEMIEGGY
jgi:imidazolonepropionase-like amidohydrolase